MKPARKFGGAFADLQARVDARTGNVERAAEAVRDARARYDAAPSPQTHAALGRAVGALAVASDPDGVTGTARHWRRVFSRGGAR